MPPRKSPFAFMVRCLRVPALAAAACAGPALAEPLAADSPFAPVGAAVSAAAVQGQAFELAGASVQGPDVSVCIFERQAKRSQWIPVGGEVDGIRVISYDDAHDTAMVMIAGARKQISMRKAVVASTNSAPAGRAPLIAAVLPDAPPPAPIASAAPVTPQTAASAATDQREARMLVSDLLEIGVQQRKAYQEAKQRAAAGTPPSPNN